VVRTTNRPRGSRDSAPTHDALLKPKGKKPAKGKSVKSTSPTGMMSDEIIRSISGGNDAGAKKVIGGHVGTDKNRHTKVPPEQKVSSRQKKY
jgi:hypothetical protein